MAMHAILALVLLAVARLRRAASDAPHDVPVHVSLVALDAQNVPVVILEEESGARMLPIWIGTAEASSIDAEIHKQRPARPNSHDFAARLIAGLEGELLRVVVTEIRDGTFYAILVLRGARQARRDRRAPERRDRHRAARGRSDPRARAGVRGGGRNARARRRAANPSRGPRRRGNTPATRVVEL